MLTCLTAVLLFAADPAPLARWQHDVTIRPVDGDADRHSIHAYYVHSPESPDGSAVLYYTSSTPDAYVGEVRVRARAGGKETVVARNVTVEDAHRAACQQWSCGGKAVVFHDVRDGHWVVLAVDLATGKERVLARDRQVGFGAPAGPWVPVVGPHWKPGDARGVELVNAETGEARPGVGIDEVTAKYAAYLQKQFGSDAVSAYFPVLSPDGKRVFFKLALAGGGDEFRSKAASKRQGLFVYDLDGRRFLYHYPNWGHPAWGADSNTVIEMANRVIDAGAGSERKIPDMPVFRGCHPSLSPDGRLFACDAVLAPPPGARVAEWQVVVGDVAGGKYEVLQRFENSRGARSWRVSHPHPVFSPDGRRVYFNSSNGPRTRLFVAEARP